MAMIIQASLSVAGLKCTGVNQIFENQSKFCLLFKMLTVVPIFFLKLKSENSFANILYALKDACKVGAKLIPATFFLSLAYLAAHLVSSPYNFPLAN